MANTPAKIHFLYVMNFKEALIEAIEAIGDRSKEAIGDRRSQ